MITIKTPERRHRRCPGTVITDLEDLAKLF